MTDLERRYDETLREWLGLEPKLAKEPLEYARRIRSGILERGLGHTRALLADPDLEHPKLAKQFFIEYKRLAELVQLIEDNALLALRRFNEEDLLASRILSRVCREIGYTGDAPLCSSTSAQYYQTLPLLNVVFIPCTEMSRLLGLADLYHEVGHLVATKEKGKLVDPLMLLVDSKFDDLVRQARQNAWPEARIRSMEEARECWRGPWLIEFTSDMLATYWVGPAYGWSNIRLCGGMSPDLFVDQDTHPADGARAEMIGLTLRELGFVDDADAIDLEWKELVRLAGDSEPAAYRLTYPRELLESVVRKTIGVCHTLGLQPHAPAKPGNPDSIGGLLNEAWREFSRDASSYAAWERGRLVELKKELGV